VSSQQQQQQQDQQRDQHSNVIPRSVGQMSSAPPPCRMAFVPGAPSSDLYGVINRRPPPPSQRHHPDQSTPAHDDAVRPSRELGPTLLEIR
jgi:hypothetical protein